MAVDKRKLRVRKLTQGQVARAAGVSTATVARWRKSGKLKAAPGGKVWVSDYAMATGEVVRLADSEPAPSDAPAWSVYPPGEREATYRTMDRLTWREIGLRVGCSRKTARVRAVKWATARAPDVLRVLRARVGYVHASRTRRGPMDLDGNFTPEARKRYAAMAREYDRAAR